MIGRVVSVKMNKTVSVLVEGEKEHPLYKKRFVYSKKYLVDSPGEVKLGDIVEIKKIRPISKRKHWAISKVLGKDIVEIEETGLEKVSEEAIAQVMPEEESQESKVVDQESREIKKEEKSDKKQKKETNKKKGVIPK